jgi:hypothetical protein
MLIARGEDHEVRNTGREPLRTLNIYVPPAYTADGDERPAGRGGGTPDRKRSPGHREFAVAIFVPRRTTGGSGLSG